MAFGVPNYFPQYPQNFQPVYQPQYQPQYQPTANAVAQQNGFVWVDGIEEANNFYVAPNNAVQLWDKNAPCIYKKSADSTGKPTMQIYDLVERKEMPKQAEGKTFDLSEYVTISQFNDLKATVEQLLQKKQPKKSEVVENG